MIELQEPPVASPARRHRWIAAVVLVAVAFAGVGVGVALANRGDTPPPAVASNGELVTVSQACSTWMHDDIAWGPASANWCQDMTGWMSQQMATGSIMGSMMWSDPDRMLSTCEAWMDAEPSANVPAGWCERMVDVMSSHMDGDWGRWDERMNGTMMGR